MTGHPPRVTRDPAGVIDSSGKVLEGLRTGRMATESFLLSGDTRGIASRADLSLLEDLRDAGHAVISARSSSRSVDGPFVRDLHRTLS